MFLKDSAICKVEGRLASERALGPTAVGVVTGGSGQGIMNDLPSAP